MPKIPFTNPTSGPLHIGAVLVQPGQTREVDPDNIPAQFLSAEQFAARVGCTLEEASAALAVLSATAEPEPEPAPAPAPKSSKQKKAG